MRRKDRAIDDRISLRAIIEKADACRLAFAVGNTPYIVTMNFGFEWEGTFPVLYFHCAREGRKLDMMRLNSRVCFELDVGHELVTGPAPCDWGMRYASVLGYGILDEITDEDKRRAGLDLVMRHYGWGGEGSYKASVLGTTAVLALRVDELAGKRKS
jgi:nitroimidazol reductase NimA-like FMN-containing flavoprotein (pyridoxamine 5'-phosphate oxidase superfamily)